MSQYFVIKQIAVIAESAYLYFQGTLFSNDDYFVANFGIRQIGNVCYDHVHIYETDDAANLAVDKNSASVAHTDVDVSAVGVQDGIDHVVVHGACKLLIVDEVKLHTSSHSLQPRFVP